MRLIEVICDFCKFLVGQDFPFTLLWKCVRRAGEAALKEITPHSHKAIKKPQRAIGMLSVRKNRLIRIANYFVH